MSLCSQCGAKLLGELEDGPQRAIPGKIGEWFEQHPDALATFEAWMERAPKGETRVNVSKLHAHLVQLGLPVRRDFPNFRAWFRQQYGPELWEACVRGTK